MRVQDKKKTLQTFPGFLGPPELGGLSPPCPRLGAGLRAAGGVMRNEGECGGAVGRGGGVRGIEEPDEVRARRGL